MVRLVVVALLGLSLPVAAPAAEPPAEAKTEIVAQTVLNRSFALPSHSYRESDRPKTQAEIAPNARFGFGMFGLKSERIHRAPVTVREIDTPRTRRAGVGFSIRF